MQVREQRMSVKFTARDREIRDHLEHGFEELANALREAGFEAVLRSDVSHFPEEPLLFPAEGGTSYTMVDVRA